MNWPGWERGEAFTICLKKGWSPGYWAGAAGAEFIRTAASSEPALSSNSPAESLTRR